MDDIVISYAILQNVNIGSDMILLNKFKNKLM